MPILDVFFSMLWFFLFIAWIWLVISVFIDIFRSGDLSGWAKAGWTVFVLLVPLLGVLIYLIARGDKMQQRRIDDAAAQDAATRQYIQSVTDSDGSVADEITKLGQLRDDGTITDAEYQDQKAKLLA
jgi:hypothetical protein